MKGDLLREIVMINNLKLKSIIKLNLNNVKS